MVNRFWKLYAPIVGLLLINCGGSTTEIDESVTPKERVIQFSGMEWIVRATEEGREGPGPNLFSASDKNVWIDAQGRLHLKIRQEGGYWYCSGVTLKKSLGYGQYVFYVGSDITELDKNVVAGLFTYLDDDHEIDIEFSKWSTDDNQNAQFVSQPSTVKGNKERFDIAPKLGQTVHSFDWQEEQIFFRSRYINNNGLDNVIHEWKYVGKDIPKEKTEKLKLNLWLFKGQMPSDLKDQEIVIDSVRFVAK